MNIFQVPRVQSLHTRAPLYQALLTLFKTLPLMRGSYLHLTHMSLLRQIVMFAFSHIIFFNLISVNVYETALSVLWS